MATLIIEASVAAPQLTITNANILSVSTPLSSSIDGAEVAVDTSEAVVYADYAINTGLFIPAGADSLTTSDNKLLYCGVDEQILPQIPYGTKVTYYEDSMLIGVFYIDSIVRVAKQAFQLNLMSGLGLLETKVHKGNVYNNITLSDLLDDIIGTTFSYTVDPAIASWPCFGWLPYDTARENLHRVLMAMGVNIFKSADGNPRFSVLDDSSPISVSDDDVYMNGSVSYGSPATQVSVTEHQYLEAGGERVILYDNTDGGGAVTNAETVFNEPYYDLQWTGQTLVSSGSNYAVVSGIGVLTGIPYTHIQKIVTKNASPGSVKNREVSVTDDGLINPLNSNNVAQRLMDYYSAAQTVSGKMILGTPRPGSAITVTDAFGDLKTGIIKDMDITSSATVAATFEAVTDYSPSHMGNQFENQATILSSGTWTVPAGVDHIRMILIGGGDGGQGGQNGTDGKGALDMASATTASQETMYYAEAAEPGQGGDPGAAGQGGSILEGDYAVTPGETITISIGAGGAGGYVGGGMGSAGSPTTASSPSIGTLSSADEDGAPSEFGYKNLLTGITYGQAGIDGEAGGAGGATTISDESGADGGEGYPGESIASAQGGSGGGGGWAHGGDMSGYFFGHASGGGGGGAAHNSAGYAGRGGQGRTSPPAPDNAVLGGDGGDGADAEAPAQSTPGKGGDGGHGGGGGGNGGGYTITGSGLLGLVTGQAGQAGRGGTGTAGADGGDGVVIILY